MTTTPQGSKDPDILASMRALRRAAKRALQLGLETSTPVYVLKRGKIVDLTKERRKHDRRAG
jgi:hypothetical protein